VAALSAGVCEEIGFRGYMQRPIELLGRSALAILVSSLFFTIVHLSQAWALLPIAPIVFGAGVLLGSLARASGTLLFGILGHWIMDIGLFAYWWTQIAGTFRERPVWQAGWDRAFGLECAVFIFALMAVITAILQLKTLSAGGPYLRLSVSPPPRRR
jgi:hypothetical protein